VRKDVPGKAQSE